MSGGWLVVLDREGRATKQYPLPSGAATVGRAPNCNIRFLLPGVSSHHASVVVHANQTIVRDHSGGGTHVNGRTVSVSALQHGDTISVAGRALRWLYADATKPRQQKAIGALSVRPRRSEGGGGGGGGGAAPRRRASSPAGLPPPPANDRHSMPASPLHGNSRGKQVAIVQPQRRDNNDQNGNTSTASTKASQWIESRKAVRRSPASPAPLPRTSSTPVRAKSTGSANRGRVTLTQARTRVTMTPGRVTGPSTPLRAALLRNAHSAHSAHNAHNAHKARVMKIEAPAKIDHTKQAALLLMTGHTAKAKISPANRKSTPSFLVRKRSSARPGSGARVSRGSGGSRGSRRSQRGSEQNSPQSPLPSPEPSLLPSPKKSSMKNPANKSRKNESIKFDLSNLENFRSHDVAPKSPSRGRRLLQAAGADLPDLTDTTADPPLTPRSRSLRSSLLVQKVLDSSVTLSDQSWDTTAASAFESRTISPRSAKNLETYSIVDLVSIDSNETVKSVYDSVGSTRSSSFAFGTPQTTGRKTRSTIDPKSLTSSTPYVKGQRPTRSNSNPNMTRNSSMNSTAPRRSKSLTTPENSTSQITVNSTRISRASKSKSRLNESDLQYISSRLDFNASGDSPKSSKRVSRVSIKTASPKSKRNKRNLTLDMTAASSFVGDGTVTPDNTQSPEEIGTPVLSIKSLLDSSQSSFASQSSPKRNQSKTLKRKTIGAIRSEKKSRSSMRSKSLNISRRAASLRLTKGSPELNDSAQTDVSETITPKSGIKITPEAVKNKHSTAKKPQSKRSIIDDLNESDIMKQLFNSPVKRKLSQSMTEFSRRQLFDDDDPPKRPTRNTIALGNRSPDNSLLSNTGYISPEQFVSPINTPENSPNLTGVKRLFRRNTPNNDLSYVRGVKSLLKSPRTRKSIKNDLTNVSGVKLIFAKSPKNRLSDVQVKKIFQAGPKNDLNRVSGVRALFQAQNQPKNDLSDVRGVRRLYQRKSAANDLTNVSGVKKTLAKSPKNDLRDVRGVRQLFRQEKSVNSNVSGVEALFNESNTSQRSEVLFDQMVGRPTAKAVYSKSFNSCVQKKPKGRKGKSLHYSIDAITNNVQEWLEGELKKRGQKDRTVASTSKANTSLNKSKAYINRELKKLATDTVEGQDIRTSRVRNSTLLKSQLEVSERKKSASEVYSAHKLPIKKRSIVEASLEKSKIEKPFNLPIKKRAVLHSTPMKGRYNLTMNASELGRVSPIAVVDKTRTLEQYAERQPEPPTQSSPKAKRGVKLNIPEASVNQSNTRKGRQTKGKEQSTIAITSPKRSKRGTKQSDTQSPKGRRGAKATSVPEPKPKRTRKTTEKQQNSKESPKPSTSKVSPKNTRAKEIVQSPVKRKTRGKGKGENDDTELANTKKRRKSLVVSKKQPISKPVSPIKKAAAPKGKKVKESPKKKPEPKRQKAVAKAKQSPVKAVTPKRGVATRRQASKTEDKSKTPKTTRARVNKTSVVVAKPSPQMKPHGRTRGKAEPKQSPAKKISPKKQGTKRGRSVVDKPDDEPKSKRGRNNKTISVEIVEKKTRGKKVNATPEPKTRNKNESKEPQTRKRKSDTEKDVPAKRTKSTRREAKNVTKSPKTEAKSARTEIKGAKNVAKSAKNVTKSAKTEAKNAKVEKNSSKTETRTRGKKVAEVPASNSPKGRRKPARDTQSETKTTRRRKTAAEAPKTTRRNANTTVKESAKNPVSPAAPRSRARALAQTKAAEAPRSRRR